MTPAERLKEIERQWEHPVDANLQENHEWLIARMKRLTEALENEVKYSNSEATVFNCRKALEDGGE